MTYGVAVGKAVDTLVEDKTLKSAVLYLDPKTVAKVTWHVPLRGSWDVVRKGYGVITLGYPNARERQFIKRCEVAGESFPLKKVQVRRWPTK